MKRIQVNTMSKTRAIDEIVSDTGSWASTVARPFAVAGARC